MFLTREEIIEFTGLVHRAAQMRALQEAKIPCMMVGGEVRVMREALRRILAPKVAGLSHEDGSDTRTLQERALADLAGLESTPNPGPGPDTSPHTSPDTTPDGPPDDLSPREKERWERLVSMGLSPHEIKPL